MFRAKDKTKEELLEVVKKEIIRLGIQDNPKRADYENNRDRELSPSVYTLSAYTKLSWKEIVRELGFDFRKSKKPTYLSGFSVNDLSEEDKIVLEAFKKEIKRLIDEQGGGYLSRDDYMHKSSKGSPHADYVKKITGLTWRQIMKWLGFEAKSTIGKSKKNALYDMLEMYKEKTKARSEYLTLDRAYYYIYAKGTLEKIKLGTLINVAKTLSMPLGEFMDLVTEIQAEKEILHNQGYVKSKEIYILLKDKYFNKVTKYMVQ